MDTGTGSFGKFGTTSIPVPDTSVSSVRHQPGTVILWHQNKRNANHLSFFKLETLRFLCVCISQLMKKRAPFEQHTKNYLSRYRREIPNHIYDLDIYRRYVYPSLYRCRYRHDTGAGTGTTSIPVPDSSARSLVRHRQYRYRTLRR